MTKTTSQALTQVDVLKNILIPPFSEKDALDWMVILHTHAIHIHAMAHDAEQSILAPLTQRGAAEVIAALWTDRNDERSNYVYWYWQFNTHTPYEVLASVPPELLPGLHEKLARLRQAPFVETVVEDD